MFRIAAGVLCLALVSGTALAQPVRAPRQSIFISPAGEPFRRDDALAALVLGLDYAATRNFGLGASIRTDFVLTSPERSNAFTTMLRAEYHWGF